MKTQTGRTGIALLFLQPRRWRGVGGQRPRETGLVPIAEEVK